MTEKSAARSNRGPGSPSKTPGPGAQTPGFHRDGTRGTTFVRDGTVFSQMAPSPTKQKSRNDGMTDSAYKRSQQGQSFDVYMSQANTYLSIGEYEKAVPYYSKVNVSFKYVIYDVLFLHEVHTSPEL